MEEQYKKFLAVLNANKEVFLRRKFRVFKKERCFGYTERGIYEPPEATWGQDGEGEVLIDRLYTKYQDYKTFGGWLRRVEKDLKRA